MNRHQLKCALLDAAMLTLKESASQHHVLDHADIGGSFHRIGKATGYAQGYAQAIQDAVKLIEAHRQAESETVHA